MYNPLKTYLSIIANTNKKGYPFSACIRYHKKSYFAVNEVISKNDPTAHAEIQAIRLVCRKEKIDNLKGATIYCSGEPCPMCLTAIAWAGIKRIWYINSYKVATSNNCFYDRPSKEVNKFLKLKRIIKQMK